MIFQGQFNNIYNNKTYFVKIGNTGGIKEIKDSDDGSNETVCFGPTPVKISSDMSDTFDNLYIRECTISLATNFDIRKYVVAGNYNDIPVEIRYDDENGDYIFTGYVNPLSFDQPYANKWNLFNLECVDKLGTLEYILFPEILNNDFSYNTPWFFVRKIVEQCGLYEPIWTNRATQYDHTQDTLINPAVFGAGSTNQDDWKNCREVLEEIGKTYGFWIWQDGDACMADNILLMDLSDPHTVLKEEYAGKDAKISVDEAYNKIKCTVDISNVDKTLIDPFDDKYFTPTTVRAERVLTELIYKNKDKKWDNLGSYVPVTGGARIKGFVGYLQGLAPSITNWGLETTVADADPDQGNFLVFEHYAQILQNNLFDFGENNYLDDGYGSGTADAWRTLAWLKLNPGKAAFVQFADTENLRNWQNRQTVTMGDMTKMLLIQIGGKAQDTSAETDRLAQQIEDNNPICGFVLNNVNNLLPSDSSYMNYIVISGKFKLTPLQPRTGPCDTGKNWENTDLWNKTWLTRFHCVNSWNDVNWEKPWTYISNGQQGTGADGNKTLYGNTVPYESEKYGAYYQYYTWNNTNGLNWPFNQTPDFTTQIALPSLEAHQEQFKYNCSSYNTGTGSPNEVDNVNKLAILACELKIGTGENAKYLCENFSILQQYNWQIPQSMITQAYTWKTAAEAAAAGLDTIFTIGPNPAIGDTIIGKDLDIQDTTAGLEIDSKGFAIPIPYGSGLLGELSFKILGPFNSIWTEATEKVKHGALWWKIYGTQTTDRVLLSHVENIQIKELKFEVLPGGSKNKQSQDNDLVYYSKTNTDYIEEKDYDCVLCTALTQAEATALGVDYSINNSAILNNNQQKTAFTGMTYKGQSGVKLEEARVDEQYNVWGTCRNKIQATFKLEDPEKCNYDKNLCFTYIDGTYRTIEREIDLKKDTMKNMLKDFG